MKLLLFVFSGLLAFHPIHVSVTEIEYDEKDKALEIMMRVFIDDLENTMRLHLQQPELDILKPTGTTLDAMMSAYLADHFQISLDNKAQKIRYLGHESDSEVFIFYLEVSQVKKWKTIDVRNSIIMETYDDQSNLVHISVAGKVRSMRLTRQEAAQKINF